MLAAEPEAVPTSIDAFLKQEEGKELLRFTTAGSVDDGKSTLIGRLLFDSKGVYEDQLAGVRKASVNRGAGPIDFSLLTDGLRAEREQGITIDVAYRYFATPRRKFIIADTPGHEQYTRNMATGASTAQLAVVLIDARKGVLPQSRRHAYIAALLGIPRLAVAVNKMDLVDFSETVFREIESEFAAFAEKLGIRNLCFIPISALDGDNVVTRSSRTPWYGGQHLLDHLETVPVEDASGTGPFRFAVQYVIRDAPDFRGYAGQVASGLIKPGDPVMALPSGRISRVRSIPSFDGDRAEAYAPMSATICLEDEIDVGRGDMLVSPARMPHVSRRLEATLVWMHRDLLQVDRVYLLKQTTALVRATVKEIVHRIDINTLAHVEATALELNEIGAVSIETNRPLFFDAYQNNRTTGCFVLIDPASNVTVGAGMIQERAREGAAAYRALEGLEFEASRLTPAERYARAGHHPATIWLHARRDLAYTLERVLFDHGCMVHVLADDAESRVLGDLARVLNAAGAIAICSTGSTAPEERERVKGLVGATFFVDPDPLSLSPDDATAATQLLRMLEDRGVLPSAYRFSGGEGI